MDALIDKLVPSTSGLVSGLSGTIGDFFGSAITKTLGQVLYAIVTTVNWFIAVAYQFFEVFTGQIKVTYKGEASYLTNVFVENGAVTGIYWGMAIISVVLCFVFTIIAVIRKMFDGSDKMQTTLGAILGSSFKSIIVILSLNIAMVAVLNVSNVLMQQVSYVFNSGSSLTEAKEIDFTEDQFATMGRVLNTIGNYSLNPSHNSRYNLNSCFNEIRGDLLYLQEQGVFEFYYLTKDANGNEIETWQSALQSLVFAASLEEELKMDVYNEGVANALLEIMDTLKNNTAFYPLDHYERTPAPITNVPFDRVLFLACTYDAALNEEFNINPSHTDPLRGPYMNGEKNIYDFIQVAEDFDLIWGFNYIIFFLIAYGMWKEMWYILLDCMARMYNLVFLYLVAPPFIAASPLDGGAKTKQWMLSFVVQCFGVFGTVIAMRLLLIFAPIVISTQLEIFSNAVMDIVAKAFLVYGFAFTARKASNMFTGILADSAGWQSITAGSLRNEWDQYKKDKESKSDRKKQEKQQKENQKKNLDTAKSAGKLAAGSGDLQDAKNVGQAVKEQKDQTASKLGPGGTKEAMDQTSVPDGNGKDPGEGGGNKEEKADQGGNADNTASTPTPTPAPAPTPAPTSNADNIDDSGVYGIPVAPDISGTNHYPKTDPNPQQEQAPPKDPPPPRNDGNGQ